MINTSNFYTPVNDKTGRVYLMSYRNNGLSYGVTKPSEGKYLLCKSPRLSAEVTEILSEHDSYEDMRSAFFKAKAELV